MLRWSKQERRDQRLNDGRNHHQWGGGGKKFDFNHFTPPGHFIVVKISEHFLM